MRTGIVLSLLLLSSSVFGGQFIQRNMYSQAHLAVGFGKTLLSAMADAKGAIPTGNNQDYYEPDSNFNSPHYQCTNALIWAEKSQCEGADIQYVIPLRHVTR